MIEEEWRDIPETNNEYQVSNFGQVRSKDHTTVHKDGKVTNHKSRILKQQINHKGYKQIRINSTAGKRSFVVHRLVAQVFIENPKNYPEVNHIDEDKTNNHFTNLEWCTTAYNVEYSQAKEIVAISPDNEVFLVKNMSKFAREHGLSNGKLQLS